ncbi:MAG: hypothetical protein A2W52_04060 [Candidatus Taylorbacteria bacterium RIFCSPHIGHO2_02_49_25]|uniref:Toxin n=1 Tax=Candidatus Taylorbacteria bacterium RIFCSPHIGHO2_02_49_25 TaxID=1802305 RepID=A0A1G2MHF7_9BACT|nr:MAG: hypothetical protein UY62_C0055G0007 [Parcubacteria group bacterium GW2011_GWF2_50_9]OHA20536.1 MAG: hypothetical protein A2759_01485 [Candidatus Taylorbacteria bacterium RIFCSPHIGHO2_01_FULL_49_60]OHA23346.1 MAG: hypothetical protein A2W52_04060 [Candidatus Taylorbacteria bacterium RIFCSPHIGHO2_02_49_25]OHA35349.1 MAG: hypothetical protein A3B27_02745 [Candidatus Taylorbacteria bacterium RIFCSPLOWO2_01_FULL_50_130]OHA36774.1 MAG: hypothetical protein A2W65_04400 [Candidatus Taylorbacte
MRGSGEVIDFEWDAGNRGKNLKKHGVTDAESEEAFFDSGKKIFKDVVHSEIEERSILVGQTKAGKMLFIAFTSRKTRIRIISSRPLNKKEKQLYGKKT